MEIYVFHVPASITPIGRPLRRSVQGFFNPTRHREPFINLCPFVKSVKDMIALPDYTDLH